MSATEQPVPAPAPRPMRDRRGKVYTPAIGKRLRPLLWMVLIGFAILGATGIYMASVSFVTWLSGAPQDTYFYMLMVALHLLLGFVILVPFIVFGFGHLFTSWKRPNRAAIRYGLMLLGAAVILLISGLVLVRIGGFEIRDPAVREVGYWLHLLTPVLAIGLYIRHRLAGPRIKWEYARLWSVGVTAVVVLMGFMHAHDPRVASKVGPREGAPILLSIRSENGRRQPDSGQDLDDGSVLHGVPQGRLRRLVPLFAPSQFVQQSALSCQRERDEKGVNRTGWHHPGRPMGAPVVMISCRFSQVSSTTLIMTM